MTTVVTKKQYECVIEELWEFQGFLIGLASKGHHERVVFIEKARQFLGARCETCGRARESTEGWWIYYSDKLEHKWWRYMPMPDCDEGMLLDAEAGSRGAYPVTVWYR